MEESPNLVTLSYPDHHRVLTQRLWKCLATKHKVDLVLDTDSGPVGVHRLILDLLVPSLAEFLVPSSAPLPEKVEAFDDNGPGVRLDLGTGVDFGGDDLERLVELLYLGTTEVSLRQSENLRGMALRLGLSLQVSSDSTLASWPSDTRLQPVAVLQGCRPVLRTHRTSKREGLPAKVIECRSRLSETGEGSGGDSPSTGREWPEANSVVAGGNELLATSEHKNRSEQAVADAEFGLPVGAEDWSDLDSVNSDQDVDAVETNKELADSMLQLHRCPSCSYKTPSKQRFTSHLSIRHDPDRILLKCERCDRLFVKVESLEQHMLSHESDLQLYKCRHCNYSNSRKANFIRHMAYRHNRTEDDVPMPSKFRCEDCNFACAHHSNMISHQVREHSARAPFACPHCSYASVRPSNLEKHVNVVHLGLRLNMCETCGRCFSQLSALKMHRLIHTNERPFQCQCCQMSFRDSHAVKRHMKTHANDKPFLCHLCSYSCKVRYNLRAHLKRVHKVAMTGDEMGPGEAMAPS